MTTLSEFFGDLPRQWKVVIGSVAFGLAVGVFASGLSPLPAQVGQNTKDIATGQAERAELRRDVAAGKAQFERIICLLTLPDTILTPIQVEGRCP